MQEEYIEFKVGQKWKTRMGKTYLIKEIKEDHEYPLVCISMDSGRKHHFDEDGFENGLFPSDNDLTEYVSG